LPRRRKGTKKQEVKTSDHGIFRETLRLGAFVAKKKEHNIFINPIAKITNNKRSYCIVNIRNLTIEKVCILDFLKKAL
jgi:hypothetical protein